MTPYIATEVTIGGYVVEREIARYIQEASISTGVNLRYLLAKAGQESSFAADARAGVTSATGMYQFTNVTWFELFKKHGARYGYPELAKKISYSKRYRYVVKDRNARRKILALRLDPRMSALMAGEYARSNQLFVEKSLKRKADSTDLYLAHFMGPVGAVTMLEAVEKTPEKYAYKIFPRAAKANPRIFYKKVGKNRKPRTVSEVHKLIDRIFNRTIRRFTNLPADVFIKIPQVVPVSRKPSEDWFANYSMVSNDSADFSSGFRDGHTLAEMLYRQSNSLSRSSGAAVDLDAIEDANDIRANSVAGADDSILIEDSIDDIDVSSLIPDDYLTADDLAHLNVVSDLGVNLDDVDAEMLDPVFQINRTFFSTSSAEYESVADHLDAMEVSSLNHVQLAEQQEKRKIQLAMSSVNGSKSTSNKAVDFKGSVAYVISSEDAAFVKNILTSLSSSPMAEPLRTQAMNTYQALKGAYNYVGTINSSSIISEEVVASNSGTASF